MGTNETRHFGHGPGHRSKLNDAASFTQRTSREPGQNGELFLKLKGNSELCLDTGDCTGRGRLAQVEHAGQGFRQQAMGGPR